VALGHQGIHQIAANVTRAASYQYPHQTIFFLQLNDIQQQFLQLDCQPLPGIVGLDKTPPILAVAQQDLWIASQLQDNLCHLSGIPRFDKDASMSQLEDSAGLARDT
jgi:hypothetical protein